MRVLCLLMAVVGAVSASAAGVAAETRRVILDPKATSAEPQIEILSEGPGAVLLRVNLPAVEIEPVEIEGRPFHRITIPGGEISGQAGTPALPTLTRLISIPASSGASLRVVESIRKQIAHCDLAPVQPVAASAEGKLAYDSEAYAEMGFPERPPARLGAPAIFRDLRVVPLVLEPVRYDPPRGVVEITQSLVVEVRFDGAHPSNVKGTVPRCIAPSFDRIYRSVVLNYKGPEGDQRLANGTYLVICPDDSAAIAILQPLLEWRTQMGYPSVLIPVEDTGPGTNKIIKDLIQDAYDHWEIPPEFVVLVGDAFYSDLVVRTFYYGPAEQDTEYALLEGSDLFPDVHIGRLSVANTTELESVVEKILGYETAPYLEDPDWILGACLIADIGTPPQGSGVTCRDVMQWIHERLAQLGYTHVDAIYEEPFPDRFTESLNNGVGLMVYRGHEPMSGIYQDVILALENGPMLPFAVPMTCMTGSFALLGTCQAEAFLRAGGPGAPAGAIGAIGISSDETYTRTNNVMVYGIFQGLLYEEIPELGATLTRGKLNEFLHFGYDEPVFAEHAIRKTNLMGDPATPCWTRVPAQFSVAHPETMVMGATAASIRVADDATAAPVSGACVCLWKADEVHAADFTDESGQVELALSPPSPGTLRITVTKWNHVPYRAEITVEYEDTNVTVRGFSAIDDGSGSTHGNGDGVVNAGETVEIRVDLGNGGGSPVTNVSVTVETEDPFVTVLDGACSFGDVPAEEIVTGPEGFVLAIGGGCPNGHSIRLGLEITSDQGRRRGLLEIPVASSAFEIAVRGRDDSAWRVNPGESGEMSVEIRNTGACDAPDVSGRLISLSQHLCVVSDEAAFGSVPAGQVANNYLDPFTVSASGDCFPGHMAPCLLALETSSGVRDTVAIALKIGTARTTDPLGPDEYGYFAFDDTDTSYEQAPVYDWVEIAGDLAGPGELLPLEDHSDYWLGSGDHVTVALPFSFSLYGSAFDSVTISPDGWMAMGSTDMEDCYNTFLPAPGGPDGMIAPFWEDLYMEDGSGVWHHHDAENHRYIVEWSRMWNKSFPSQEQTFQAILYDPVFHPTATADGEILFQYQQVINEEGHQAYSSVGIENQDHSDGLLYTYFNWYPDGAAPLEPGRAIRILPMPFMLADGSGVEIPATRLHANFPNPFSPVTTIRYDLPAPGRVSLRVYSAEGRLVRTLVDTPQEEPGYHLVPWDGRDDQRRQVVPGVYFYRLDTLDGTQTKKMVLLR